MVFLGQFPTFLNTRLPQRPWPRLMSISAGLVPGRGTSGSTVWTRSPERSAKPPRKNCSSAHFPLLEQEGLSRVVFKCLSRPPRTLLSSVLSDALEKVIKITNKACDVVSPTRQMRKQVDGGDALVPVTRLRASCVPRVSWFPARVGWEHSLITCSGPRPPRGTWGC